MPTNVIHSIGQTNTPTTMDYSSLATWAAACPSDLTVANENWIGEVYNQGELVISSKVTMSITTSSTQKIILRAGTGQSFIDNTNAATNPLRYNATVGAAITGNVAYDNLFAVTGDFETYKLQWRTTAGSATNAFLVSGSGCTGLVHETIASKTGTGNANAVIAITSSSTIAVTNCAIILEAQIANGIGLGFSTAATVTNCTLINISGIAYGRAALSAGYASVTATDCAWFGFANAWQSSHALLGSYNATDQSTLTEYGFGGAISTTNNITSVPFTTATFQAVSGVTYGSGSGYDFKLSSGSSLIDVGTTGTSTDILGTIRPQGHATDVGCYEVLYVAPVQWAFITWLE